MVAVSRVRLGSADLLFGPFVLKSSFYFASPSTVNFGCPFQALPSLLSQLAVSRLVLPVS